MKDEKNKQIIGCEEWCAFPDLGIPSIKARVDSGAKTSSIHAFNVQKFRRQGETWVSFEVHPLQNNRRTVVRCERPIVDKRVVKSSSGISETRYVILATLKMGDQAWEIELTLANRDSMGYRMLLGREAMSGRMLVDPALSFCQGQVTSDTLNKHYGKREQTRSGLKIAVLASNQELYSNQRILEAGEERGHEMEFLDIKQCYMKLDAVEPEAHYRGGTILDDLDAVITRIRPSITYYGCALARQFESMNVLTVNTSVAITQSRDKLYSLQLMLKSGINIPTTGFANSPIDTNDLIEMVGGAPLIVKLLEGSQGRGVVLAETRKAAESVINAFKALRANLLVQEFIKEAEGKDLRCFVIDGKVVASIQREAAPGEFRANIHQGGTASIIKITPTERKLAVKASKALGLMIAGVDIIRSKHGPLLLEVNSSPGLEGIEAATGKDIAGMMISAIEKKLNWKRELSVKRHK
ncbi:30S ribosomal protein S6--L-glutamate ligase [Gimesia chilikensis]|jgi:ribosomal protein S6--L-glutamate ligase|uniref:Probable alpha-L-glutamate ligase n=1 Tax=Gimesia chilikensis TaxID=2605989 RepID=A0A517PNC1_9PLAN|nr:30S ribosomal protein S6--L-glutamate ligase [Gimesia chilikensis]MBN72375.1 30S ribosomal protein S6--L-glutamate ligase [Gimesia sp.]MCR9232620.1 30S ribosomal protein S6--L-glutamate ligase [bacterium]QDT20859.1 Ribosomal protein S6 modification protein [Gimesia chilikensis]QDT84746.1 Ribosomal protein S6 modification protein [Gimesia chilikensis]